jgi:GTPase SAR1 family protein
MTALDHYHCTYTNVSSDKQRNNHLALANVSISLLKKKPNNNTCYCAKIVITGDLNVGKTSLIRSLVGSENMSVLKGQRTGRVKTEFRKTDTNIKMDIWDTAGNE